MKMMIYFFCILFLTAYGLSLFADYGWFFDLFSHFAIQYAIGAILLAIICFSMQEWIPAIVMIMLAILNGYEVRESYSAPWVIESPYQNIRPNLNIVHFNKLYTNNNWSAFDGWVKANYQDVDLFIIQEMTPELFDKAEELKEYFPFSYPNEKWNHFNDVMILSRTPFEASEIRGDEVDTRLSGTKIVFQSSDMKGPVHIYSIHAYVPFGARRYAARGRALSVVSDALMNDPHPHKIMTGDWNLTPYSPVFQKLLDKTGLHYNDYSIFPKVTWNSRFILPIFKIPIDHMINSSDIQQISKKVGPSLGSDHHMLVAKFYVPES